ncbi:MAG: hypothetical protein ABI675_14650 [Chitinophagaceae bacterium]
MNAYNVIEFERGKPNDGFEMKINSSIEDILSYIHSLEDEIGLKNPDFVKLKSLCLELISRLPLPVQLLQNSFILRGRENLNGEVFSKIQDLSYNPYSESIGLGRFNLENEQVFYGALPITSHNASGQLTTICESCKELFDSVSNQDNRYFTVGKWNITKPIKTIVLTFFDNAEKASWHLGNLNPGYQQFLFSVCNNEDLEKCNRFYSFFSGYAARKYNSTDKYLLTTAFFQALRQYYGEEVAVLYSSSMTDNSGLNIALSKQIIDTGYLNLEGAVMFKVTRNRNNFKNYLIVPCTDYALPGNDDQFRFGYIL